MTHFYSYLWLREDGTPYYVGKGSGKRAYQRLSHHVLPPKDKSRILVFPQENEAEAFESEMAIIALFGRKDNGTGCLRNRSDGGENPPNWKGKKRSDHMRSTLSETRTGMKFTEEHCENLAKGHHTEKALAAAANARIYTSCKKGSKRVITWGAKISAALVGRPSNSQEAMKRGWDKRFLKTVAW